MLTKRFLHNLYKIINNISGMQNIGSHNIFSILLIKKNQKSQIKLYQSKVILKNSNTINFTPGISLNDFLRKPKT